MSSASGQAGPFPLLQIAFSKALQELLQEKRQYQAVDIHSQGGGESALLAKAYWHPAGSKAADIPGAEVQAFALPQVRIWCGECQGTMLFKPDGPRCRSVYHGSAAEQSLLLSYQCKDCSKRRVTFLVTRRGASMELSGRDPLDALSVPSSLPRSVSRFFAEAQIAHHTGQDLAALCLLREFIEQFWLRLPEIQEAIAAGRRMTVDEVADMYSNLLPLDFKTEYPDLARCHEALKAAIDGAETRPDVFQFCSTEIVDHLDGRRFRRLSGSTASPFGEIRPPVSSQSAV
jgi:ribosomal protein S27E